MLFLGLQNINHTFLLNSKQLTMSESTLFLVSLLLKKLSLPVCSVQVGNCMTGIYPCLILTSKKILLCFYDSDHCLLFWIIFLLCWQTLKRNFHLSARNYHRRYFVCCLLVSKYIFSTVFLHLYMKMHQP